MTKSTIVLSASALIAAGGAFAAFHLLPCGSCHESATAATAAAPAATVTTVAMHAPAPAEQAKVFTVDPVHSSVVFRIKHAGVSYFQGRFNDVSGTFALNAEDASKSTINVTVKSDSIDTNNAGREKHLKTADFFAVAEHDSITFAATSVKKTGEHSYEVTGDLSMLGKTKSVTAAVEHVGDGEMKGKAKSGLEAVLTIKRSDFGMTFGVDNGMLGDEVRLTIGLEGGQ